MPFLRNELSKIFENVFRIKNYSKTSEFDVGDILNLFDCKMSSRKLLKLNLTPESHPTA